MQYIDHIIRILSIPTLRIMLSIPLWITMIWFIVVGAFILKRIPTKTNVAIIHKWVLHIEGVELPP